VDADTLALVAALAPECENCGLSIDLEAIIIGETLCSLCRRAEELDAVDYVHSNARRKAEQIEGEPEQAEDD